MSNFLRVFDFTPHRPRGYMKFAKLQEKMIISRLCTWV